MGRRFRSAIIMGKSKEMGYCVCGILFGVRKRILAEMPVSKVFLQLAFPAAASRGCGSRIVKL